MIVINNYYNPRPPATQRARPGQLTPSEPRVTQLTQRGSRVRLGGSPRLPGSSLQHRRLGTNGDSRDRTPHPHTAHDADIVINSP